MSLNSAVSSGLFLFTVPTTVEPISLTNFRMLFKNQGFNCCFQSFSPILLQSNMLLVFFSRKCSLSHINTSIHHVALSHIIIIFYCAFFWLRGNVHTKWVPPSKTDKLFSSITTYVPGLYKFLQFCKMKLHISEMAASFLAHFSCFYCIKSQQFIMNLNPISLIVALYLSPLHLLFVCLFSCFIL